MSEVFISYSHEDGDIADRIREDLKQLGFKVFYDQELVPGESWPDRLAQELKRAKYILVLLSPSYVKSRWTTKELEAAALSESEGHARIIPIVVRDTDIPPFLSAKVYADFRQDYETGLDLIKKALTVEPEPSDVFQARRYRRLFSILAVLASLLGSAVSAISAFGGVGLVKVDPSIVAIVIGAVAGLTTLVAVISTYRSDRRSGPIEIVARGIERAYVGALEESNLNPLRFREARDHD